MATLNSSATRLLLFFLFAFIFFATESTPTYSAHYCTGGSNFEPNSTYQTNLIVLLSSLTSNASLHPFLRTTIPSGITGLFLCRGDINDIVCQDCVAAAAKEIIRRCHYQTESIIWYDVCMLRYSNNSYLPNIVPGIPVTDPKNISSSDLGRFNQLLSDMLEDLASEASTGQKFATKVETYSSSQNLYGLAQCTPDTATFDCIVCFGSARGILPTCCEASEGASLLLPACNMRYQLSPFFNLNGTSSIPPPAGNLLKLYYFTITMLSD